MLTKKYVPFVPSLHFVLLTAIITITFSDQLALNPDQEAPGISTADALGGSEGQAARGAKRDGNRLARTRAVEHDASGSL